MALAGELDMAGEESLLEAAEPGIRARLPVEVDLRELAFADSSGIRLLLLLDARSRREGGPGLAVRVTSEGAVRRALTLMGLQEALEICEGEPAPGDAPRPAAAVDLRLPAEPLAPAVARRALEEDDLPPEVLPDAQLLVTELVTNSIRHAGLHPGQWIGVRARPRAGGVRLEVCDPGPGFPAPPPLPRSVDRLGGRGLPIVDRLAARWGAGRTDDGRWEVWVELDVPAAGSAPPPAA